MYFFKKNNKSTKKKNNNFNDNLKLNNIQQLTLEPKLFNMNATLNYT